MATTFDIGYNSGWVLPVTKTLKLETIICDRCGILYAVPEAMVDKARALGHGQITWSCPNGHAGYGFHGKSTAEKTQESLDYERSRAARLAAERDQAKADARAQKAAKTRFRHERDRLRTRAANGVCPCCNRSFEDLRDHMVTQHPEFPPVEPTEA